MTVSCTSPSSNRNQPQQGSASPSAPASTEAQSSSGSDSAALSPGRYCYGIESEDLNGVIRLTVAENQSVTGDSSVTIQSASEGYYSSYAQKLEGLLDEGQIAMDITTWIEYDVQESQEVWTATPETLQTEQKTFTAIDCAAAQERFVGADGLEAADLLEGATALNSQQVQFEPGTSTSTLEGGVARGERNVYRVSAQGGQQMALNITSPENNAVFDVISPSGYVLARESTSEDLLLPQTGDYQIVVGGTRGNAVYTLKIDIP
ncbi:MAG: hypothetical protein ICV62_02450 [Cyanobacteria bacterium Co-bin13]|nr:hypothetical protein [Cyanobacteria bacterium Co-bin13]